MKYLMGIDGGGTKSRLLVTDTDGNELYHIVGGSTNLETNTPEEVRGNFMELFHGFLVKYNTTINNCQGICVGSAGVDNEISKTQMISILHDMGFEKKVIVVNDAQIALAAQTKDGAGIILISGTGSIGYGKNDNGETWRVGGYGHLVGDEGSGYWIACKGFGAILRAMDLSAPETIMTELFKKEMTIDNPIQVLDFIFDANKGEIARFSRLVVAACEQGDLVATDIMTSAADYFVCVIKTILKKLKMEYDACSIVYAGGILLNTAFLRDLVNTKLKNDNVIFVPEVLSLPAEWGAIYMAKKALKKIV